MSNPNVHPDPAPLRAATDADVPAIVALERQSFPNPHERFEGRVVRHLIHHPRLIVTVAEYNGALAGWVAGFPWLRGRIPWGRIYAIAVDPKARGQQLGRRLMQAMIDDLEQRGSAKIFLEVRPDNAAALALYQKFGFVECKTIADYYGHGVAAIRMVRITPSSPAASP